MTKRISIVRDEDAVDPRDSDNLGHMICWHHRYNLGDSHDYITVSDLFLELLRESNVSEADIRPAVLVALRTYSDSLDDYRTVRQGGLNDTRIQDWFDFIEGDYLDVKGIVDILSEAVKKIAVILPVYLYDHSGISVNTTGFNCPWDSGQVGYIYVTREEVEKEYGEWNEETQKKAREVLESEVKVYNQYIEGDVWGYVIETQTEDGKWVHEDSCFGFYGQDIDTNGILANVESELHDALREAANSDSGMVII